MSLARRLHPSWIVVAAMVLFAAWFSADSIHLHDAHLTHKADLGQIDLAIWNSAHGRWLQEIKGDVISTRLTDHVEPIFIPISAIFWLWDDVRALLMLQAVALALGAWPIFLLARRRLRPAKVGMDADWLAVVLALAFLSVPALQSATSAEFHALPLAVPLIGWAFWASERSQWGRFALAALLLMSVQEGMALLAATIGAYVGLRAAWEARHGRADWRGIAAGAVMTAVALAWFYFATFVVIPHFASQAYATAQTPYAARYGQLGDSFGDVLKSFLTQPLTVLRIAIEPMRLRYLLMLLAPTGFLALFGPELLLVSAPLLLANLLSSFPFQYSGELHYSAPLAPIFFAAAAVGMPRARNRFRILREGVTAGRFALGGTALLVSLVAIPALWTHVLYGYTPLAREFWRHVPGGWPVVTAHDRLLQRFAEQIPNGAPLSVTTDLYPHLSHRERIYQFPVLGDAEWALIDVSGTTDGHPADIRGAVLDLLDHGWGVVDGADGYLLLAEGVDGNEIPAEFYDFVSAPDAAPVTALNAAFGDLELLGVDVIDDVKWRRTGFRFYWRTRSILPDGTSISVQVLRPDGTMADDTLSRPMPSLLWLPPSSWPVGETMVTDLPAWYEPGRWAVAISVTAGGRALSPTVSQGELPQGWSPSGDGRLLLAAMARQGGRLVPYAGPVIPESASATFMSPGWSVSLTGWSAPLAVKPGDALPIDLGWRAAGPAGGDYTVFLHLTDAGGHKVASADATPTWFTQRRTNAWPQGYDTIWDSHTLSIPADAPEGQYELIVGWYDWQTGDRLPRQGELGNDDGDSYVLGPVTINRSAGIAPDLACLVVPASCASQDR